MTEHRKPLVRGSDGLTTYFILREQEIELINRPMNRPMNRPTQQHLGHIASDIDLLSVHIPSIVTVIDRGGELRPDPMLEEDHGLQAYDTVTLSFYHCLIVGLFVNCLIQSLGISGRMHPLLFTLFRTNWVLLFAPKGHSSKLSL